MDSCRAGDCSLRLAACPTVGSQNVCYAARRHRRHPRQHLLDQRDDVRKPATPFEKRADGDFVRRVEYCRCGTAGLPSACAIGVRMSGLPSCASIEPSTYSTSECTMLCG